VDAAGGHARNLEIVVLHCATGGYRIVIGRQLGNLAVATKANGGAVCIPLKPVPVPPNAPVAIRQTRTIPPDKNEMAELRTGDSTARRNLEFTEPCTAIQKPAAIIRKISIKRIKEELSCTGDKFKQEPQDWDRLITCP
jgi:hypothetical protein